MNKVTITVQTEVVIEIECNNDDLEFIYNSIVPDLNINLDKIEAGQDIGDNDHDIMVIGKMTTDAYDAKVTVEQLEKNKAPWGYHENGEVIDDICQHDIMLKSFDDAGLNETMGTNTTAYDHGWEEWIAENEHLLPDVQFFIELYNYKRTQI